MAPHGKLYYSAVAFFAFSFGILFALGAVRAKVFPVDSRLFGVAFAIILLLGAL